MTVSEQKSYFLRKPLPDCSVDPIVSIKPDNRFEKGLKDASLAFGVTLNVRGVSGIETDPKENESYVGIVGFGFGAA
jgi:hypothetical protein